MRVRKSEDVKIDIKGIEKGYGVDRMEEKMERLGIN